MVTGILIILLPLLIYAIGALSVSRKDITNPNDFFVAYRKIGVTAFSSSSIAYAFQVSTIYPFLLWGASHFLLVPIVNTVCWGLGILLFYACFRKFKPFIGKDVTIHGFLGERYGQKVRVVASYLTITAFLGFTISETYFGSKVLLSVISDRGYLYVIVTGSLLFVYAYIVYGGQISSIRTDQLQLIISYIGIFGLMLYLMFAVVRLDGTISSTLSWGLLIMAIYLAVICVFRRFRFMQVSETDSRGAKMINLISNNLVVITCVLLVFGGCYIFLNFKTETDKHPFFNLTGFGTCGLLSLILLPLSFQFVDLTNWQRLLSVRATGNQESLERNIRKGLLTYALESPFTWIIFVFFGLLTVTALPHFTFTDLMVDLPRQLIGSGNLEQKAMGFIFITSVLAIMLSTIDSFIMGIIFTFVFDSHPASRKLLDDHSTAWTAEKYQRVLRAGRRFGLILLAGGILFFIGFDKKVQNGGELFINIMLAFYAAQLSFLPHVLGVLFLRKLPRSGWAIVSMVASATLAIGSGIYAVVLNPDWAWYPILICLGVSFTLYLLGAFFDHFNTRAFAANVGLFFGKLFGNLYFLCCFITSVIYILVHTCPVNVKMIEMGVLLLCYSLYFLFFIRPRANWHAYYSGNTFYCDLIFYMTVSIFGFTAHFVNLQKNEVSAATKIWELSSYLVTLIYTWVFWWGKNKNGPRIIESIQQKKDNQDKPLFNIQRKIDATLFLLILLAVLHTLILFLDDIFTDRIWLYWIGRLSTIFTILLIIITYRLFIGISNVVIKHGDKEYTADFSIGLRYVDRPVMISFCFLGVYSLYIAATGNSAAMNPFFSGAIAFELLLSSASWANTDTLN